MPDLHTISVTVILVNKEGRFLIVKRSDNLERWPGKWAVPGGKLEKKGYINRKFDTKGDIWYDVIEMSIRREVKEEVGLDLGDVEYVTSLAFMKDDGNPHLIISLYSNDHSGKIKLNDELTDFRWVTLKEAEKYDLIEGIYEELKIVNKKLKK